MDVPNTVGKDLVFRLVNLPEGMTFPLVECHPGSGHSTGDTVRRDGRLLNDAWPVRMAWPESVHTVTMRLGVSVVPWRTVATTDGRNQNSRTTRQSGDPNWPVNFHHASARDGQTQLTVVRGNDDRVWQTRIVAVDTNGVEHFESDGTGTPGGKTATWTYMFRVPLAQVKEFRAQIRPLYWVEFRDVALQARGRRAP